MYRPLSLLAVAGMAWNLSAADPAKPVAATALAGFVSRPAPRLETVASGIEGDSFDDPAIWIHPTDPARSLVLGTNKKNGLFAFDLDGRKVGVVSPASCPNNVDLLYGFPLNFVRTDIALAVCREKDNPCVRAWKIDPKTRTLSEVTPPEGIKIFGGEPGYGSCTYHSRTTGKYYLFVNHKSGKFEQYVLGFTADGRLSAHLVRTFAVGSQPEGCVADEEAGALYLGEEDVGVWKFSAEENGGTKGKLIAKVGENGLKDDVEGVTLYTGRDGKGYVIVSSQGNNTFKIYDRAGNNEYIGTIDPAAGRLGKVSETDGIAVTNRPLGDKFPHGLFVVQDGTRKADGQRFKYYAWEDVAGDGLLIDTGSPASGKPSLLGVGFDSAGKRLAHDAFHSTGQLLPEPARGAAESLRDLVPVVAGDAAFQQRAFIGRELPVEPVGEFPRSRVATRRWFGR